MTIAPRRVALDIQRKVLYQSLSADLIRLFDAARDIAYYSGSSTLQGFIARCDVIELTR